MSEFLKGKQYSYEKGDYIYYDDGSYSYKKGDYLYHSDGSYSYKKGDYIYHSDGSYSHTKGDYTYESDGSVSTKRGNGYTYYNNNNSGCYITTACVRARGLADDCRELTTLRKFRDNYVVKTEQGKKDSHRYYAKAPQIVKIIDTREDSQAIYEDLYTNMILKCVQLIDHEQYDEAYKLYKSKALELEEKYYNIKNT